MINLKNCLSVVPLLSTTVVVVTNGKVVSVDDGCRKFDLSGQHEGRTANRGLECRILLARSPLLL